MDIEKTIRNLKLRGFSVQHFATGAEAAHYINEQVDGCSVGIGGCKTADQLGMFESLSEHNTVYWHWRVPGPETLDKAWHAQVYLSSANAMTEDGQILNIDGTGNRLAALAYGKKRVYLLVSTNKICPDFDSALARARNVAAVQNCKRFPDKKTPCKIDDKCHDCRTPGRICNALLVLWGPMFGMETEVVLIDEALGM